MNDFNPTPPDFNPTPPKADTIAETATRRAEAAATRRRWVTLAEIVGVAGLAIAALSLWLTWSDRRAEEVEKRAATVSERRARTFVLFGGTVEDGGDRVILKDAGHDTLQSIDILFPADLKIVAQTGVLSPRIEAGWFATAMLKLTDNGPDVQRGRMPVRITAVYWDADQQIRDSAIYDVAWRTEGRLLRGRAVRLEGVVLRERSGSVARLDALWAAEKPKRS